MRFGLSVINAWPADFILQLAATAEKAGWEGFFLWDHVTFEFDVDLHDPWLLLGAIAASTKNLRLGALVTPLARRRPQIIGKQSVTLDHLSRGRAVLGVGLGGVEREFSAFGEESNAKVRAEKLDEALEIITRLWSGEVVEHYGKHYTIDRVALMPKPVQRPRIPIWVGGHSKAALRRASRWDGWASVGPSPSASAPGITLKELQRAIAYIQKGRTSKNSFDVVYTGESHEDARPSLGTMRQVRLAGATWWLESIHGRRYSKDEALERVEEGPPRN